ncbi:MAG: NADH-quinone oxidoreductase subunit M [Deltaproteobacteria bacterium RBG_13_43_22]|nr:MAG: NADH-quinone oxidoreductase subunit M [Deltaproteobacteria bacterium RBG_13_43_22]
MDFLILNQLGYPVLSTLIFLPLAGAVVLFLLRNETTAKVWSLIISIVTFALSLPLYFNFDITTYKYQFAEHIPWIPGFKINYTLGVDGISLLLVLLSTLLTPICILASWKYIEKRVKEFLFCLLLIETACVGVFSALDFVLFYIFFEAMLVPMYLLIAVWGGPAKVYASIKFFIYTMAGSVFLMVAMIALYLNTGTFSIPELMTHTYSFNFQFWVFLAMGIAFAIKVPMAPLHTWLPAAHVEAPTAGSVILASVLLKMGTYGFVRFCLPILPQASIYFAPYVFWISIISILYGGYVALGQSDMKRLIAYSSVAHMGFVTLGTFLFNKSGLEGAMLQMINHGVTTGALFLCVGIIYERSHSRLISINSGISKIMPVYIGFLGLFSLSSMAFPGTNSFVGELLVLIGTFADNKLIGALTIPGVVLAAAYMLRLLQKIAWGGQGNPSFKDMNLREIVYLVPLAIFVLWIGFSPGPFLDVMHASVDHLIQQVQAGSALALVK